MHRPVQRSCAAHRGPYRTTASSEQPRAGSGHPSSPSTRGGMMSRRRWVRAAFAAVLVPPMLVIGSASPSQAKEPAQKLTARQNLAPAERIVADKAPTSRLAKTDKALLNRTDSTVVSVVVKLDYDSTSTYAGGIAGLSATSPS